ncbi:MAG: hypothetical protein COX51_07930, partial [Syntrophobacteraceae bacterium CG23_combo_of_CG06-09_8_20_14_all_50_8]
QPGFLDTGFRRYDEFAASRGECTPRNLKDESRRSLEAKRTTVLTVIFNMKVKKIGWLILGVVLLANGLGRAENVTVRGNMSSAIRYELQHQITAGDGMKTM